MNASESHKQLPVSLRVSPENRSELIRLVDIAPALIGQLVGAARELVQSERFEEATPLLDLLALVEDSVVEHHRLLAVCCERTDRPLAARRCFDRAIELDETNLHARLGRASVHMQHGARAEALEDLKAARAVDTGADPRLTARINAMAAGATN